MSLAESSQQPSSLGKSNRRLVVAAILLAMFLSAMEATVIGTAMPTVVGDLGGLELYGWVGAVYMLATTVTIPVYGKLADSAGRKKAMLVGITLFLLGSMGSGLAPSIEVLIAMRALQGIGAGGIQPVAMTLVGDLYTPTERARVQGIFGAVWGVAGISGPLVGGLIVRLLSWRWVFYLNVPFGLLAAALLASGLKELPTTTDRKPLDIRGALLLTLAVLFTIAGARKPILFLPGILLSALFVWAERTHPAPLLPLTLLRRKLILASNAASGVLGAVMVGIVTFVPLYVQAVRYGTPTEAGATVAPMLVGWPLFAAIGGRIMLRTGPRVLVRWGMVVVTLTALLADRLIDAGATITALRLTMFFFGAGMGLASTALLVSVQESVTFQERGVATASSMFFRMVGGALAAGLLGGLLSRSVSSAIDPALLDDLLGPEHGKNLDPAVLKPLGLALQEGMATVFHAIFGLTLLGAATAAWFPFVAPKHEASEPVLAADRHRAGEPGSGGGGEVDPSTAAKPAATQPE